MKLDNRDLVLRGLLGILPAQLERYLRSALGDNCTPETLAGTVRQLPLPPNIAAFDQSLGDPGAGDPLHRNKTIRGITA